MILCPYCNEEIEDKSHYCDQCGHLLLYCMSCLRVGSGRRCTHCGGIMAKIDDKSGSNSGILSVNSISSSLAYGVERYVGNTQQSENISHGIPAMILRNSRLGINISAIDGAIIGRKNGPYKELFEKNMYVSGVHAQLDYNKDTGWSVMDKNSSNGTRLNNHMLKAEEPMSMKNGDILTIANVNLEVIINIL